VETERETLFEMYRRGVCVDGFDFLEVYATARQAVERAEGARGRRCW
jgi:TPP-dependent pyruvate/acetoin dehydrogenase alpha subunit